MSDLISRSATIQRFIQETEDSGSNVIHINTIKRVLQDIETAYNVDAVVEELKEISKIYCEEYKQREGSLYLQDAVEIVRKGGVNE